MWRPAFVKGRKLLRILVAGESRWIRALGCRVAPSIEHESAIRGLKCESVVDIGANRGQFALIARHCFPSAKVFSVEPLPDAAAMFRKVFVGDSRVVLHEVAVGPVRKRATMHVSGRDDSSSLLPIGGLQVRQFPGTAEVGTIDVLVVPLATLVSPDDIVRPALLKLDVQGFEMAALIGCEPLLPMFDWVLIECSFVELYSGQELAGEVLDWLGKRGFLVRGVYGTTYGREGEAIQADFLLGQATDRGNVA